MHIPVLLQESLDLLSLKTQESVLDVTVGLAGHAAHFCEKIGPEGQFIGLDADEKNLQLAHENLQNAPCPVTLHHINFLELPSLDLPQFDIIFADLGMSSPHVDDPERGFSYRFDAPLDLRFDRTSGWTAAQYIQSVSEETLIENLRDFGELRNAPRIARSLQKKKPERTTEVVEAVEFVIGFRAKSVLPQLFQALRIAVNRELDALAVLLQHGPQLLKTGGRMGVISFHSLEDRMVKQSFKALSTPLKDDLTGSVSEEASFELLTKKPIKPSEEEIDENIRARSALLRGIKRIH